MAITNTSKNQQSVAAANASNKFQAVPSYIPQTERLFTTRSRSALDQTGGGDRGQRCYIKILSGNSETSLQRHLSEEHGKPTSLGDSSKGPLASATKDGAPYGGYADFLLTSIQGGFEEKLQITEVFGDGEVTYYFGKHPVMINMSGILIDSVDNNWFVQWMEMYAHVMRGSQLARNFELLKIVTPNMTFIGTINRMNWNQDSSRDVDIPFQFSFLAKQIIPTPVMIPGTPSTTTSSLGLDNLTSFRPLSEIKSIKDTAQALTNTIKNPSSTVKDYAAAMLVKSPLMSSSLLGFSTNTLLSGTKKSGTPTIKVNTAPQGSDMFSSTTSNLAGIRTSLFSPVYGVLSSLTKLIKATTGSVASVINSFANPVKNVLRDIKNISNQATGIVNLVNSSIQQIANIPKSVDSELRATLASLKKTSGVISHAPQSIASNLRDVVNSGKMPASVAFLQNRPGSTLSSGSNSPTSKIALLNSGKKYTPQQGARL